MRRIGVIDDDVTTRSLIKMLLEMEGYIVINLSTDYDEILLMLDSQPFNALFVDVHLHNQSGLEIVKQIRALDRFSSLKILMTSGMEVEDKCLAVGSNGFLLKPFMPGELTDWLRANLVKE